MNARLGGTVRVEFEGRGCKFRVNYPQGMPFEQMEILALACEQRAGGIWVQGEGENPTVEFTFSDLLVPEVVAKGKGVHAGQWELLRRYFRVVAEASIEAVWKQVFVSSQQQGAGLVVPRIRSGNGNPR